MYIRKKQVFALSVAAIFLLTLAVGSSFWFRFKLIELYHHQHSFDKEADVYEKVFRKLQALSQNKHSLYGLFPGAIYETEKKLWRYYKKRDPWKAYILLKKQSRYQTIKEELSGFLDDEAAIAALQKEAFEGALFRDAFQREIFSWFKDAPYWTYLRSFDLMEMEEQERKQAVDLMEKLAEAYPFLKAPQQQLNIYRKENHFTKDLSFDLAGHWSLNENAYNLALDISGYGNHGIIQGAEFVDEEQRQAFEFNGEESFIKIPVSDDLCLSQQTITVAFWLKLKSRNDKKQVSFAKNIFSVENTKFFFWFKGGRLQVMATQDGRWQGVSSVSQAVHNIDQWYHIAWTYSAEGGMLYVDGVPQGESVGGQALGGAGRAPLILGGGDFHGFLADLWIFNRKLSAEEIRMLISQG